MEQGDFGSQYEAGMSKHFGISAVSCRLRVKVGRTRSEQMSSGLPLRADITRCRRHVSKVPLPDSYTAANDVRRIAAILRDGHFEPGQFY